MTLYLKYRSQTIEDLDLTDVRETLKRLVAKENIPHAFLFAGPKGTGKTSAARILAKVINCEKRKGSEIEPCNKCSQCISITRGENLDVIELDAASNRGIDDVRVLRESVKLSPAAAGKKIFIIDEAHMLTTEASNALLKTLEEPPEHVVFILATTNPEKLIETIRSRTTLVQFKKATNTEIVRSLKRAAEGEKLKIEPEILSIIAKAANGAFREGHKVLDTLLSENINLSRTSDVEQFLFNTLNAEPVYLLKLLAKGDPVELVKEIEKVTEKGVAIEGYIDAIVEELHGLLLTKLNKEDSKFDSLTVEDCAELTHLLLTSKTELKSAVIEQLPLEIAVIEWCNKMKFNGNEDKSGEKKEGKSGNEDERPKPILKKQEAVVPGSTLINDELPNAVGKDGPPPDREVGGKLKNIINQEPEENGIIEGNGKEDVQVPPTGKTIAEINDGLWSKMLAEIRSKNASTEALLRASRPLAFDGKRLTLGVYYSFHKEKLESQQHRIILEDILSSTLGVAVRVDCTLTEPDKQNIAGEIRTQPITEGKTDEVVLTESADTDIIKIAEEIFSN